MNPIDPLTVVLSSAVMSGLMSLVLYSLKRNYPSSIKGLGEWSAALLMIFVGSMLAAANGALPFFFTIFMARATLALGLYLTYVGTQHFFGETPQLRRWLLVITAYMLGQLWLLYVEPSFHLRFMLSNVLGAYLLGAHAYLVFKQGSRTFARALTIAVLLAMSLVHGARFVTSFIWPINEEMFNTSSEHLIYIGSFVYGMLLFSISTVLLASERLHAELVHLVSRDALTQAATRRYMSEACSQELERCRRHGRSMALMLLDMDHFKRINDTYGHQAGDRVLINFVAKASALLRRPDLLGRFGGEEFVVLLPDTTLEEAVLVAERIRAACALPEPGPHCTVSIGVATYQNEQDTEDSLLARADDAMYLAKRLGRNRVEAAADQQPTVHQPPNAGAVDGHCEA